MQRRDLKHTSEFDDQAIVVTPASKQQALLEKQLRQSAKDREREQLRREKLQEKIDKQKIKAEKQQARADKRRAKAELREQKQQYKREQIEKSARYAQSPTCKDALKSLRKLNASVAWKNSCWAVIVFSVLFVTLAILVVDQAPIVDTFNLTISATIQDLRGDLDPFVIALTTLGDALPMIILVMIVLLILYIGYKWDSLIFYLGNVVLALVCVQLLKIVFAVPRPMDETLVALPSSFSFPSAHSFMTVIVFGMIGLLFYRLLVRRGNDPRDAMIPGVALLVVAFLVGLSRIYVGVHWPTDVLGGWLLGGAWLAFAGALYTAPPRK